MEFRQHIPRHMHRSTREEMICIKSQHFYLNRILLLAIGLWPYQQSTKLVRLQIIWIFGLLTSFIIFQLTTFVTAKCTPDLVIKILTSVIYFLMHLVEYISFWINMKAVKYLLEQLQHICNQLRDENEIAIMRNYGNYTKLYTFGILLIAIGGVIIYTLPFWSNIAEFFLYMNMSRPPHVMHIMTEYFVDKEEYFYLVLLHMSISCCIGALALIATCTIFIGCVIHFCGMFRIASYRIEHAMANSVLQNINLENKIIINNEIVLAVDIHRQAMRCSTFLVSNFEGLFFTLILLGVTCLSLSLFRIMSFGGTPKEFLLQLFYVCAILIYMFGANYAGQEIIDHNNRVFFTAYNVQWHVAPLHIQKLILLLLQRGNKPFCLNIGGLFVASLESFAMLISTSISYFTVMYSTQQ